MKRPRQAVAFAALSILKLNVAIRSRELACRRRASEEQSVTAAVSADVEAAGLRIVDRIGVPTVDAGRARREGLKRLAKQLVGGAAGERERRKCEPEKEPHRSADIGRANFVLQGSRRQPSFAHRSPKKESGAQGRRG
jgi:hypothetical protein